MTDAPANGTGLEKARPSAQKTPYPIVLIALFQFLKAGFLLFLFLHFWKGYSAWAASGRPEESLFLRGFVEQPFLVLFPILSVGFVVIGWGLLRLKAWARALLTGAIICTWVGGKYGSHLSLDALFFGKDIDLRHSHFPTIFCVFLLDLFVFCCLVFYPGIAATFSEKEN